MENIFFLVLVAVVGLLRWLSQAAENKRNAAAEKASNEAPGADSMSPAPRASQTEEERVRKFFEALGVPTSADPPPRVQPRETRPKEAPRRKILPVDPFPKPRGRVAEPRPPVVSPLPPLPVPPLAAPPLPTRESVRAPAREIRPDFTHAAEFEVRDIDEPLMEDSISHAGLRTTHGKTQDKTAAHGLAARLGTGEGLRDAIVLREIFGPPRSMQPLER